MPKMHIGRSIEIKKPMSEVKSKVGDFHTWASWSPWLIMEPEAMVKVRADGKYYSWEGKRTGSGEMTITEDSGDTIKMELTFLKPWKSKAKTNMHLKDMGDSTRLTWTMDSSLPWFMFWMKKSMEGFVGMDYERGLNMLKEWIESGTINSKLKWEGVKPFEGCDYIGVTTTCDIKDVGSSMTKDFDKLANAVDTSNIAGPAFSIYHKWDVAKGKVTYTSGMPVKDAPASISSDLNLGKLPKMSTYVLSHYGDYQHLGNAWSTMSTMQRNKEFKVIKGQHPFEVYKSMPGSVPVDQIHTEIHFPVQS